MPLTAREITFLRKRAAKIRKAIERLRQLEGDYLSTINHGILDAQARKDADFIAGDLAALKTYYTALLPVIRQRLDELSREAQDIHRQLGGVG